MGLLLILLDSDIKSTRIESRIRENELFWFERKDTRMIDEAPPKTDLLWTITLRIASSLFCAALACVLGLVQPIVWYLVWSVLTPGLFGNQYQALLPALVATVGVIGGAIIGLIAGAIAPSRVGMALSCFGLGLIHIATGLYFTPSFSESLFAFGAIPFPAVVVDCGLAA